jgi:hypothetical protein
MRFIDYLLPLVVSTNVIAAPLNCELKSPRQNEFAQLLSFFAANGLGLAAMAEVRDQLNRSLEEASPELEAAIQHDLAALREKSDWFNAATPAERKAQLDAAFDEMIESSLKELDQTKSLDSKNTVAWNLIASRNVIAGSGDSSHQANVYQGATGAQETEHPLFSLSDAAMDGIYGFNKGLMDSMTGNLFGIGEDHESEDPVPQALTTPPQIPHASKSEERTGLVDEATMNKYVDANPGVVDKLMVDAQQWAGNQGA